jgi:hypothetical protein
LQKRCKRVALLDDLPGRNAGVVGHQKALFSEFWPGGKDASDIIRAEGAIPRQSSASKHFN